MLCPVCHVDLLLADRQGIEIDYCPKCRGIWLDRGELDKLIERSSISAEPREERRESSFRPDRRDHREEHDRSHAPHKRKRGSFLEDIFDF